MKKLFVRMISTQFCQIPNKMILPEEVWVQDLRRENSTEHFEEMVSDNKDNENIGRDRHQKSRQKTTVRKSNFVQKLK